MPNLEEQVNELKDAGYPVRKGIRQFSEESGRDVADNIWLHRWAKHAAQNYPIVTRSAGVRFLENAAKGVPAFVIGIGPSLDNNIAKLKGLDGRALIFATDAAYRPLLANGIIPDLVMTYDCQSAQKNLFDHSYCEDPPALLCNSCSHPDTISAWEGPILFYNQWHTKDVFIEFLLPYIFPLIGQIPSSGTVGNMLVNVAYILGCNPIFTVGMDLCYAKHGEGWRYRCQDYKYGKIDDSGQGGWIKNDNLILYDNDDRVRSSFDEEINGEKFRVDAELKTYREALIGLCRGLGIKIIDCSVDGILRMYFRTISVEQAALEFCTYKMMEGRTVVPHLSKIIPDGRKIWEEQRKNGWVC